MYSRIMMLSLLMAVGVASTPEIGGRAEHELSTAPEADDAPVSISKDVKVNELKAFVGSGATVLASECGDLDRDGDQDVLLVLDHQKGGEGKLVDGASRSLVLLIRDDAGQLRKAGENDAIVPCAKCGGVAGDPFSRVRLGIGAFAVLIEGGSRERWSDEYVFGYSVEENFWLLDKVRHGITDTITGEARQTELTRDDFGAIRFDEFDPSELPLAEGA